MFIESALHHFIVGMFYIINMKGFSIIFVDSDISKILMQIGPVQLALVYLLDIGTEKAIFSIESIFMYLLYIS